jgi:negative regulator of sigma E activity
MSGGVKEQQGSQLSAMFDGELPAAECELLARRLGRDPQLRAQWSRYALIGAAMRGEPTLSAKATAAAAGAARQAPLAVADRVAQALGTISPAPMAAGNDPAARTFRDWFARCAQPIAGAGVAAGVAALSVFWLQGRVAETDPLSAAAETTEVVLGGPELPTPRETLALVKPATIAPSNGEPESYTVPAANRGTAAALANAQFANYVVAHSEYTAPMNRRNVLSAIVASDPAAAPEAAPETVPQTPPDAARPAQEAP